jgi:acetyltransferase-like isoleucine patch superfamily enzyme
MLRHKFIYYIKLRYVLFVYRTLVLKLSLRDRISLKGFFYGIEKDVCITSEDNGLIELGRGVYISKRTDIKAVGGVVRIGSNVSFNKDCTLVSMYEITIGDNCKFGEMVSIYDHNHNLNKMNEPIALQGFNMEPIEIGNNVWIGGKVFVKSGIKIGNNVIVGANSTVTKNIPDNHMAYGNPIKIRPLISN